MYLRLGTPIDNDLNQVAYEVAKQGYNASELMALPELNSYMYKGYWHDGRALVCSSFVTAVFDAAGLFPDMEMNHGEFGPSDLY